MNRQDPIVTSDRGILLEDNVNLEWLKQLTPRFNSDFCKFVVNLDTNRVYVGMFNHADACELMGISNGETHPSIFGGNIYWDGDIIYSSTLNIFKNQKNKPKKMLGFSMRKNNIETEENFNPRIITDEEMIMMINNVLFAWIEI